MRALDWLVSPKNLFLSLSLARSLAHSLTLTLMMELHLSRSFFSRSTSSASLIAAEGAASAERQLCAARERAAGEERPADECESRGRAGISRGHPRVRWNCTLRARARPREGLDDGGALRTASALARTSAAHGVHRTPLLPNRPCPLP